jgi:hypothetical protein
MTDMFHDLSRIFPTSFIVLSIIIAAIACFVFAFAMIYGVTVGIDSFQGWIRRKRNKPMATPQTREQVIIRHISAVLRRRADAIRWTK